MKNKYSKLERVSLNFSRLLSDVAKENKIRKTDASNLLADLLKDVDVKWEIEKRKFTLDELLFRR